MFFYGLILLFFGIIFACLVFLTKNEEETEDLIEEWVLLDDLEELDEEDELE